MKDRRETAYDEHMAPLVTKLLELSKEHSVPILISAGMRDENGREMSCSSLMSFGNTRSDRLVGTENRFGLALAIIRGDSRFDRASALAITKFHDDPGPEPAVHLPNATMSGPVGES